MSQRGWGSTALTIVATCATLATTYCVARSVSSYGWEGTFWYIWEGSPYPPAVRKHYQALEEAKEALRQNEEEILEMLEETLERARLNCVDGASNDVIMQAWTSHVRPKSLEQTLAKLSYELDKRAAQIDAVSSAQRQDLKQCKKQFSNHIVQLMERADVLVAFYKKSQQPTNKSGEQDLGELQSEETC